MHKHKDWQLFKRSALVAGVSAGPFALSLYNGVDPLIVEISVADARRIIQHFDLIGEMEVDEDAYTWYEAPKEAAIV